MSRCALNKVRVHPCFRLDEKTYPTAAKIAQEIKGWMKVQDGLRREQDWAGVEQVDIQIEDLKSKFEQEFPKVFEKVKRGNVPCRLENMEIPLPVTLCMPVKTLPYAQRVELQTAFADRIREIAKRESVNESLLQEKPRMLRHLQFPEDDAVTVPHPCSRLNLWRNVKNSCFANTTTVALFVVPNKFLDQLLDLESLALVRAMEGLLRVDPTKKLAQTLLSMRNDLRATLATSPIQELKTWFTVLSRQEEKARQCVKMKGVTRETSDPAEYLRNLLLTLEITPWLNIQDSKGKVTSDFLFSLSPANPMTVEEALQLQELQSEVKVLDTRLLILEIQPDPTERSRLFHQPLHLNPLLQRQDGSVLVLTGLVDAVPGHFTAYFPCPNGDGTWWLYDDLNPFLLDRLEFGDVRDDTATSCRLLFYSDIRDVNLEIAKAGAKYMGVEL